MSLRCCSWWHLHARKGVDDLAVLAESDPLEFRQQNLPPGSLRNALTGVAEEFDWGGRRAKRQPNRGIGLVCRTEKGSHTAAGVEVELVKNQVRGIHARQSLECGAIKNPANLRRQGEGCLVMGMGSALHEEMLFASDDTVPVASNRVWAKLPQSRLVKSLLTLV